MTAPAAAGQFWSEEELAVIASFHAGDIWIPGVLDALPHRSIPSIRAKLVRPPGGVFSRTTESVEDSDMRQRIRFELGTTALLRAIQATGKVFS